MAVGLWFDEQGNPLDGPPKGPPVVVIELRYYCDGGKRKDGSIGAPCKTNRQAKLAWAPPEKVEEVRNAFFAGPRQRCECGAWMGRSMHIRQPVEEGA